MRSPIDLTHRADEVAPLLLGWVLRRGEVALRLTEVEAYLGLDDPASHAYRGPRGRAATMFRAPGCLYVYLSYGVHRMANIVCSPAGSASAVLLRAGEVVAGVEIARHRRGRDEELANHPVARLASGPGNLGAVLGLDLADDGARLGVEFSLEPGDSPSRTVMVGPRTGISHAVDWPLRFWLADEPSVSPYRRSPRASRPAEDRL